MSSWASETAPAYVRGLWRIVIGRLKARDGQALVEYALIIALVAIGAMAALHFLGSSAVNTMNGVANTISKG